MSDCSTSTPCSCSPEPSRRAFLAGVGAAAAAGSLPAIAGPFGAQDEGVPRDKKLTPAWLDSLTARGEQAVASGSELRWIGMPVGGIGAGTVYLGGDGRLWLWDVFNHPHEGVESKTLDYLGQTVRPRDGANFVQPPEARSPFELGVELRVEDAPPRPMDREGWTEVRFTGEYPVGRVVYRDPGCPLEAELEAFSPFVPLRAKDSNWPATVLGYTWRNPSDRPVRFTVRAATENPVLLHQRGRARARLLNRVERLPGGSLLLGRAAEEEAPPSERPDLPLEDFERPGHGGWEAEGTAFGDGPVRADGMPAYQGEIAQQGERLVNSHHTRGGEDVVAGDAHTGTLTGPPFRVERRFLNFLVGGGPHAGRTCVQLLVGGQVVREQTGHAANRLRPASWEVSAFEGREARLRIVDLESGPWGNIGADAFVQSDRPAAQEPVEGLHDFGSFALALAGPPQDEEVDAGSGAGSREAEAALDDGLRGSLARRFELAPGEELRLDVLVCWHFPNLSLPGAPAAGREYAARFRDAGEVATALLRELPALRERTLAWRDTWYDSTLPWWLLDRTMATASTLATTTANWLGDGRFWGWEGVGCCAGTCTHVWHYAQAVGRLFPELERDLRERTDFAPPAFDADSGRIDFRGGLAGRWAADGQAGVVLRALREHQMSADDRFLRRNWASIRAALRFLIAQDAADGVADGALDGEQHNTLDAEWYGRVPHLTGLYLAALAAGEAMAAELGDADFAAECRSLRARGAATMMECFDGESFVQLEDPAHADDIAVGRGVHIDQVMGQGWAHQLGLGRLWDATATRSALEALWQHNFVPDMGRLRAGLAPGVRGRPYAVAGDAGLVMCTWPKGGRRADWERHWQYGYFNECMSGFEYQAAGHMVREGLLLEGLAVTRAIHDRYHPRLRNPYNEVECSDHYARAMAAYGVHLAVCGYEYHGPAGRLGFAPRIRPEDFRAAFTAAEGWGSYWQRHEDGAVRCGIDWRAGSLRLRVLTVELPEGFAADAAVLDGGPRLRAHRVGRRLEVEMPEGFRLGEGRSFELRLVQGV